MEGEQTDYVWGVIDMVPVTDFPHVRAWTMIHSNNGSCMLIPREDDKIRLYVQLNPKDVINGATGRVDRTKFGPDEILEVRAMISWFLRTDYERNDQVARKTFHPYTIDKLEDYEWWTLYQSMPVFC